MRKAQNENDTASNHESPEAVIREALHHMQSDNPLQEEITLTGKGVKSVLSKYTPEQAIAEVIWNSFDAHATVVNIDFEELNTMGNLSKIIIADNGHGIPYNALKEKFKPFHESQKANKSYKHHSIMHGKNGVGRLTFFNFARKATWITIYQNNDLYEYSIEIISENLNSYSISKPLEKSTSSSTETTVVFEDINELTSAHIFGSITDHLKQEFGWFLELNKTKGYSLKINGKEIDYESIIGERDSTKFIYEKTGTIFEVEFIRWNKALSIEFSKFYLINKNHDEVWKDTTKLNKKGDCFYHSAYVKSDFFTDFVYNDKQHQNQIELISKSQHDEEYKFLEDSLTSYLQLKRKPFLKQFADQLIHTYEKEGIIPEFNAFEEPQKIELENVVKGLYQIQPSIFSASNIEQKKTFVRLLNALLISDQREQLLAIINEVIELNIAEKEELLTLLKSTKLTYIIRTIKFITNRYEVVNRLKQLIFNKDLNAKEVPHLQKMIDQNYWIFGEQFHLVASTEDTFDKALRKYIHILRGEDKDVRIDHPDKYKQMDIFLCRQNKLIDTIENVVLELKRPSLNLGETEVSQVKKYMSVILSEPQFNGVNTSWIFILVGNKFDTTGYIERELENAQHHGEKQKGLIFKHHNYRIYVRKWSDVFTDFECRHRHLEEQLKLQRDGLHIEYQSVDEIVSE